jgi:glycosyltransferase involved in cell wall biosynthesis
LLGEERTSRILHPLRIKIETVALREAQHSTKEVQELRLARYLLPRSRRVELEVLDRMPVQFERIAPATSAGRRRIALILPWLTTGGVERAAIDMAAALRERYDLHVLTAYPSRHEWEHRMLQHATDVLHLGDGVAPADQLGSVVQVVRDRGIEAAFMSNSWLGYETAMALKRHLPRVRTIDLQHTDFQAKGGDFARQSCERYDRYLDLRLVVSDYLRRRYVGYGVAPEKIRVVHLSCDEREAFNPERVAPGWLHEKLRLPYEAQIVAFIGRLVTDKDPVFVTRVYGAIRRQWTHPRRPLHFVFIGEGVLEKNIREEAALQGIEQQIHILPSDTPMAKAMRDLDLVLMSSKIEGLPLVFIEAMSLKVPVVSTQLEGIPELVDEEVGACVENVRDEMKRLDLLRNAALPILEDPGLRERLGENARRRVLERFNQAQTRRAYQSVFAELFGEAAPRLVAVSEQ